MGDTRGLQNFVPVRRADMLELLCQQEGLSSAEQGSFRQLAQMLEATFHYEYHARLEALKADYAPFDPDSDTCALNAPKTGEEEAARLDRLFSDFAGLLERANFQRLSHEDIEAALGAMSDGGMRLDVDFDVFDRLEVFARGDAVEKRSLRRLRNRLRVVEIDIPVYQRLVVIFRLRPHKRLGSEVDAHTVYLKLFKDIPQQDLEMLLPGGQVRMSVVDQAKVWFPTISGVGMTLFKIIQGALSVAAAGVYGTAAFLGMAGGAVGYGAKSFFGYLRTKEKYRLTLTSSLYYRNLDNNAGVLFRLLDEAEEQECREALLAYYFLWREAGERGWDMATLDRRVERFLAEKLQVEVDFEIDDAMEKLRRLGLVREVAEGCWKAEPIGKSLIALDDAWDDLFDFREPGETAGRMAA
ncbi:MAG: TMEM143 family protein [Pirellulales bacterium]